MENNTEINQCKKAAQKICKEIKSHNFCHSKDERAITNWGAIEKKKGILGSLIILSPTIGKQLRVEQEIRERKKKNTVLKGEGYK